MKTFTLAACLACLFASTTSSATVITFEDVDVHYGSSPLYGTADVADGYGGLSGWHNVGQVWGASHDSGINEAIDGKWFNGTTGELVFDDAPVVFTGTYYKSYNATDLITSIELYYQGTLVHSLLDPQAATNLVWLASGYNGLVDKILIRGGNEGFAIDNFTYSVAAVPESATLALLLPGLALIWMQRHRSNKLPA